MNRLKIFIIQIILTVFLLFCYQHEVFSQEIEISTDKKTDMFIGLCMGPSQTQIKNEGTLAVSELLSSKKNSFFGSVEIGYFFSNYLGLSSGMGFISCKTQLSLATYQNKFNTTDSENESYERQVSGSDIKEIQNVGLLTIPICINIRLPFNKTIGFFLEPGVNLSLPLSKNYESSGTFTYKGYYATDNVVFENLPAYGFPSNLISNTNGELELKPLVISVVASAGFDVNIQKKTMIALSGFYNNSLSSISEYSSPDNFKLSSDVNQINSLMGGSNKAILQWMGVKISLRYYLK